MAGITNIGQTGFYLYGVTLAKSAVHFDSPGVAGGQVEQLTVGSVAAIVSRVPPGKIRAQRANLAAHHQVQCKLADRQPILPVAFGTVVEGHEQLCDFLGRNHDRLLDRLRLLQGKAEIVLKVYWETPNIFEYFVAGHAELKQMRDRLFRPGNVPSIREKIELGKLFESLLRQSRERHTDRVVKALSPHCAEIRTIEAGGEKLVMKLACLLERDRQGEFENAIDKVAKDFNNNYCFKYGNPSAPYNFADVDLELEEE